MHTPRLGDLEHAAWASGAVQTCRHLSIWHLTFLLDEKLQESCLWLWGDIRGVVKKSPHLLKNTKSKSEEKNEVRETIGLCGAAPPVIFEARALFHRGLR